MQNQCLRVVFERKDTIVLNRTGLFLIDISRHPEHLHFHQRVHDGGFLVVHFGELLG